eukprot:TRINITY_DN19171_c0_g1_i6.p1 TRINITY_DN19171_c0_g1~~TRINITY_DN19171_c0_g1_i6.p1  ORF type:complete len:487 (+),score=170.22 TRINITY_DN19171_c0_g1_i6:195-1655(+)
MRAVALVLLAALVPLSAAHLLKETFENGIENWVSSSDESYTGRAQAVDGGMVLPEEAKRYGISTPLSQPWQPGTPLVLQYELTFTDSPLECGGAYMKMLSGSPDLETMKESDPFTIMFGPDKCGSTNKVHLILKHKNPVTGKLVEHHASKPARVKTDKLPHLYTLVVRPDNTFSVLVDQVEEATGSLTTDFEPPFTPLKEIPDPDEKKPDDWVDEPKIPDPEASKPDDWDEDAPETIPDETAEKPSGWYDDEPLMVPDPSAVRPDDWNDEDDGPWEAPIVENPKCKDPGCGEWKRPVISNPEYKGKWSAPMIDNTAYKGVWKPQNIPNPEFFECEDPAAGLAAIGAVAVEVWLYKPKGVQFGNVLVTTDEAAAEEFGARTWKVVSDAAKKKAAEEAEKAAEEARKRRIEEGGIVVQMERVALLAMENPMVSLPLILVVFLLALKMCMGGNSKKTVEKEKVVEEKEKEETKRTLRKRKTDKSSSKHD